MFLYPLAFRLLQGRRTHRLTPYMVRVTLEGDALAGYWKRSVANWDHHQPLDD